jgi:triosephosphate isomerase
MVAVLTQGTPKNCFSKPDVDGGLIGGASLEVKRLLGYY